MDGWELDIVGYQGILRDFKKGFQAFTVYYKFPHFPSISATALVNSLPKAGFLFFFLLSSQRLTNIPIPKCSIREEFRNWSPSYGIQIKGTPAYIAFKINLNLYYESLNCVYLSQTILSTMRYEKFCIWINWKV